MVKLTDLSDALGVFVFVETRSPADVNIVVPVSGTEVERMRLQVTLVAGVFPGEAGEGTPSASAVVKT
jgi:hypothetical protein